MSSRTLISLTGMNACPNHEDYSEIRHNMKNAGHFSPRRVGIGYRVSRSTVVPSSLQGPLCTISCASLPIPSWSKEVAKGYVPRRRDPDIRYRGRLHNSLLGDL